MKYSGIIIPGIIMAFVLSAYPTAAGESKEVILARLSKVNRFAFGGTGYAGIISQGEKDYKEILNRPSAKEDFLQLLDIGNPQARCYALTGLHAIAPKEFNEIAPRYSKDQTEVDTISGCIVMREPLSSILAGIRKGRYRLTPNR